MAMAMQSSNDVKKFFNYIKTNDIKKVIQMIYDGFNPNVYDENGNNIFHYLLDKMDKDQIDFLMNDKLIDINHKNKDNITPIIKIFNREDSYELFKDIYIKTSKLVDINQTDSLGRSLLQIALEKNNKNLAEFLLSTNININLECGEGNNALHYSLIYSFITGDIEMSKKLLLSNSNIRHKNNEGYNPYELLIIYSVVNKDDVTYIEILKELTKLEDKINKEKDPTYIYIKNTFIKIIENITICVSY